MHTCPDTHHMNKRTTEMEKEMRGIVALTAAAKREYTAEETNACSIEAKRNGGAARRVSESA
jgi:hypothetical protein